jgi:hypothetical protein
MKRIIQQIPALTKAIQAARDFANGKITAEELNAAAAYAAAYANTYAAASAAERKWQVERLRYYLEI